MATANKTRTGPVRSRKRIWLLALIALAVLGFVFWGPIGSYAQTGTAYGARVACACRFVGGRALDDCAHDFEPGMELVSLSEDVPSKSVTARFALGWPDTAAYYEGAGCVLDRWEK